MASFALGRSTGGKVTTDWAFMSPDSATDSVSRSESNTVYGAPLKRAGAFLVHGHFLISAC